MARDEHDERERDERREDPVYGAESPNEVGGEQQPPLQSTHEGPPRDQRSEEPLGPVTPDDERPAGDTPEAHDEITPHDLPKGHPGRAEAERDAAESGSGSTRGNR
jgi:hypothetical protein